jgi:hypothetical protein
MSEHWAMSDDDQDDRPARRQDFEDQVEERRKRKTLADCGLPDGFRLVTPKPRQMVQEGLLVWSFVIEFVPWNGYDLRPCYHASRYETRIPDDMQMRWALSDFTKELMEEGYDVGDAVGFAIEGKVPAKGKRLNGLLLKTESKLAGKIRFDGAVFSREMLTKPAKSHGRVAA